MDARDFLKGLLYTRSEVDDWISGRRFPFAKYDPDLGYVHRDRKCKDAIDGSDSVYTYDKRTWSRTLINHVDEPCRINTYGDSYTSCEQVNNGETWQEILAAHLGEPIRNFGIGGYSVYQMYLRMLREERVVPAKYIIVNIYDDDHYRSLMSWQRFRFGKGNMHFKPPQPYVCANPSTRDFTEFGNPCPEPNDLYDFCSLDSAHERLKDDFCMRIVLAKTNVEKGTPEDSYKDIEALAEEYGLPTTIKSAKKLLETVNELYRIAAMYATAKIVEKVEDFASSHGKRILYVASYSATSFTSPSGSRPSVRVPELRRPGYSYNRSFVKFMRKKAPSRYVDLMDAHLKDFSKRKLSVSEYLKLYYVIPSVFDSHYAPLGNHFTAFALKDLLVETLYPKPPSYRRVGSPEAWNTCVSLN